MDNSKLEARRMFLKSAVVVVATTLTAVGASSVMAAKPGMEKCMGIVKKGMNDCGTSQHACAGQSKHNDSPEDWIYVPIGTCQRITGGKVKH